MIEKTQTLLEPRTLGVVNWIGFWTLLRREVQRFFKVFGQTVTAPVMTSLLYYVVFSIALGRNGATVGDVPFLEFLAPGLIMMSMAQNAFMNTSSSMVISKYDGSIVDLLMPPLSSAELAMAKSLGGVMRGLIVGFMAFVTFFVILRMPIHSFGFILLYGFLGTLMLSLMGFICGIWADKFDNTAAVTNFVITPLTFLSGTFYSVTLLSEKWQYIVMFNPFFYMIDGFRYGFTGHADGSLFVGGSVLVALNLVLWWVSMVMLKTGYKIKS